MKKILTCLTAGLIAAMCFGATGCEMVSQKENSSEDNNSIEQVAENEILVSGMNNFNEITNWIPDENTSIKVNREEEFIKGGDASAKLSFARIAETSRFTYKLGPNCPTVKATQLIGASVWVYNDNSEDTELIFGGIDSVQRVIFSQKFILAAESWTEVSMPINQYQMQLINPSFSAFLFVFNFDKLEEATFYVDALKANISTVSAGEVKKTQFEDGEVLNFNTINDCVWATPNFKNTYGPLLTVPVYNYAVSAPLSENGGALRIDVYERGIIQESTHIWNGGLSMVDKTGFKIPQRFLNNIDFVGMNSLSIDVYHNYVNCRMLTLMILDELGTSATVDVWTEPNQWTTITISDLQGVDLTRVASIEFYYADYLTLEDYSIYVDNLQYHKGG